MSPARQEETAAPEAPLQRSRCARVCIGFALVAALAAHAGLLAWGAWQHSPTVDEVGHLAAGVNLWRTGSFDWYRVNPPLVRAVAAIPVVILRPGVGPLPSDATRPRAEFTGGVWFAEQNGADSARLFSLARWASIPWSLLGACVCFQWARALYGDVAGVLALILWCFCPNVLGHGQLITPDVGASALGAGACFLYWRWLRAADWPNAILAGFGLGLAELAKFTWILLFLVWPVLWLVWRFSRGTTGRARNGRREALQVAAIMLLGVFIINTGYGFEGSFKKLDDYDFVSRAFRGAAIAKEDSDAVGNRFRGTWLGTIPVPVPANYLSGMDVQKDDFEQGMWSYLRGKWRFGGWWYYYLYALAVKVPLGTWSLATLAFLTPVLLRGYSASWRDELVLLAPAVAVLGVVSSETGFNHHMRYVLPAFPFAFVWIGRVGPAIAAPSKTLVARARAFPWPHRLVAAAVCAALLWSVVSSLSVYPHSLSYFNELAGGPRNGGEHLLDSNIDWGQDLFYLKRWLDAHPATRLDGLAYFGMYPPELAGIGAKTPPSARGVQFCELGTKPDSDGPRPGWYAVSVNLIHGNVIGGWSVLPDYLYFQRFQPAAMAGYSIYIYHVTLEEANRVRRELGLAELLGSDEG